jgi:hypothetical protein
MAPRKGPNKSQLEAQNKDLKDKLDAQEARLAQMQGERASST